MLLCRPTATTRVWPTSPVVSAYPAKGVHAALDAKGTVELLKGTAVSSPERKSFDFCGKFLGMDSSRHATKSVTVMEVAEAEFTDCGGGKTVVLGNTRAPTSRSCRAASRLLCWGVLRPSRVA